MQELNSETLSHALRRCYDYPNYKVGCVFDSVERKTEFSYTMRQLIRQDEVPEVTVIQEKGLGEFEILFQNGSKVKAITNAQCRGRSFHEILLDFIPLDNTWYHFKCMETPYIHNEDTDVEDGAQALDEFLNSFTVR